MNKDYTYWKKKAGYKPDSVILNKDSHHLSRPQVTLRLHPPTHQLRRTTLIALAYVTFHRIEFTWFHYSVACTYFLLHWSSPYVRGTGVTRYTALRCPDFPLSNKSGTAIGNLLFSKDITKWHDSKKQINNNCRLLTPLQMVNDWLTWVRLIFCALSVAKEGSF